MAAFAKPSWQGNPSIGTIVPDPSHIVIGVAGEAIALGDACYIKNDGKIWRSIGTAANAAAKVRGYAVEVASAAGQPMTLYHGIEFGWPNAGTPGADLFLGTVAGGLDTTVTTGGTAPIGYVVDTTRVRLNQSGY